MINLNKIIQSIDGKPISTYTKLYGRYEKNNIIFNITNIYGGQYKYCDVSIEIPKNELFKEHIFSTSESIPISSYLLREFTICVHMANDSMQQNEANVQKGFFLVYKTGQRVLQNTVVIINDFVKIKLSIKLPYNTSAFDGNAMLMNESQISSSRNNRKKGIISARAAKLLLIKNMPMLVNNFINQFEIEDLISAVKLYNNQLFIRRFLKDNGYVAFIANGAILPRKGKTDYKNVLSVVPFQSPQSMNIEIYLPDGNTVSGMGIKKGITIIIGDAYHGKSTLLCAIKEGIYNHIDHDGREYVITDESALSINSEDGRSITNTDISFFLSNLPVKAINPLSFSTDNASGSTSQAAAVTEALEMGCKLFLFDEDRSANNFMYKDDKMRSILKDGSTSPFIDNARMFYLEHDISSIIVVGASGDYLRIADRVILVDKFISYGYTDYYKDAIINQKTWYPSKRHMELNEFRKICLYRKIEVQDNTSIKIGSELINISEILPHVTQGQLSFICSFLYYLTVIESENNKTIQKRIETLYCKINLSGMENIHQLGLRGNQHMELVDKNVIMRILYRLRCVKFK